MKLSNHIKISLTMSVFFLLFWFNQPSVKAQKQQVLDSLLHTLDKFPTLDTNRINAWCEISYWYVFQQPDKALYYAQKARNSSIKLQFYLGEAKAYNHMGLAYLAQFQYDNAEKYLLKSVEINQKIKHKVGLANNYNNLGIVQDNKGNFTTAVQYHEKALALRLEIGDNKQITKSYNNLGSAYHKLGDYEKALANHQKALQIQEKEQDLAGLSRSYSYLGNILKEQGEWDKALTQHLKALEIREKIQDKRLLGTTYADIGEVYYLKKKPEKAIQNYQKSLEIYTNIKNKKGISYSLLQLGEWYAEQQQQQKAWQYYQQALQTCEEIKDQLCEARALKGQAAVEKLLNPQKALQLATQAFEKAKLTNTKQELKDIALLLTDLYKQLQQPSKALEYQSLYIQYKDSLMNEDNIRKLEAMRHKYILEKQYAENELLKKDKKIQEDMLLLKQDALERQNIIIIAISIILVLAIGLVFIEYKYNLDKKRINRNLMILNQEISEKNEEILVQSEELQEVNEEMIKLNENLESLVTERTQKLQEQNHKLINYAFLNAHHVRAPLARVLGLITLAKVDNQDLNIAVLLDMLQKEAQDLDDTVSQMNELLEDETLQRLNLKK